MSAITELDKGIIRNMMLKHTHKEIAAVIEVSVAEVNACILHMITGTAIVTKQMIIDQKKPAKNPLVIKERKQKPKTEKQVREDYEEVKRLRMMNMEEHRKAENAKRLQRSSFKTRQVDLSRLVRVRIDNRTSIFIKPNEDPEKAIEKFYRNRVQQKKSEDVY